MVAPPLNSGWRQNYSSKQSQPSRQKQTDEQSIFIGARHIPLKNTLVVYIPGMISRMSMYMSKDLLKGILLFDESVIVATHWWKHIHGNHF